MSQPATAAEPTVIPFALKDAPALIEHILPVQKLSAEAYKEQMAGRGKTLTTLGSYWKGRKPLILAKACVLGCLLPTTNTPKRDLEVFEMLMGMDDRSFAARSKRRPKPQEIIAALALARIEDYFKVTPPDVLPQSAPVDWSNPAYAKVRVSWKPDVPEWERRSLEAQLLRPTPYRERVNASRRPEEVPDVHEHIWDEVNAHLGTDARTFPELVEQLGVMRYGTRPKVADAFCGSGQIPFEAARIGCDVYASDLNPVACMLTWGAFHIVGTSAEKREAQRRDQEAARQKVLTDVEHLGIESDGNGWHARAFVYCVEVECPETGWKVPLLPSRVISKSHNVVADLVPDSDQKRYDIVIQSGVANDELKKAESGTIDREGRYGEAFLVHVVGGKAYKTKISTLRGDVRQTDGSVVNRVRRWRKNDVVPEPDDLFQERLYCIQWMRPIRGTRRFDYDFRGVTEADLERERVVERYVRTQLAEWKAAGWIPDMRIEVGGPPRYQGRDLVRSRGWAHWQNIFNPRQLLLGALLNRYSDCRQKFGFAQVLNCNCRLSLWDNSDRNREGVRGVFNNQALSTLFNYGCRASRYALDLTQAEYKHFEIDRRVRVELDCTPAEAISTTADIFVTDPPYGDAVKYEEIVDFFIAWLRGKPPAEFSDWVWDGRRALAIQGEDEKFRRGMVNAYKRMNEMMPSNGMQIIMFTHQSGAIWADMANIVWAAGLRVTAAWYVVTETDNALREGSNVKGTVLLVCRKRAGEDRITRDELAWEIQDEVMDQVEALTGLNQEVRGPDRDENVFEDADIQMAGYAAALRTLTRYARIDGRDMTSEAIRPRVKNETTFVDGLIAFAVDTANQCLVPQGIPTALWQKLSGAERFYLKMLDLEARGAKALDNYQNFREGVQGSRLLRADGRQTSQPRATENRRRVRAGRDGRKLRAVRVSAPRCPLRGHGVALKPRHQRGVGSPDP